MKRGLFALLLIGTATALTASFTAPSRTVEALVRTGAVAAVERPNIVVVMTDDQTDDELAWMPLTRAALQDDGIDFSDAISPHPLCCPARAELVTGQYAQNNGVRHNSGAHGGFEALDSARTIGSWFSEAGYRTGLVGKYLNRYGHDDGREPGWTLWDPLVEGVYDYVDFAFFDDGLGPERYRDAYVTEAIEERTNQAVRDFARTDDPFLLFSWHLAPHYRFDDERRSAPPLPAEQDAERFPDAEPESFDKPSFSEARIDDQPEVFRHRNERREEPIREEFRARIRSLQAVDRSVASLVDTLKDTDEWDNTYLFFVSDNGYSLGEHRYVGKNVLTEEALQVPLLVAGPGIEPGSASTVPATLVDLPATFVDLADVDPQRVLDGASLVPFLHDRAGAGVETPFRDTTLVQTGRSTGDGWQHRGVRTDRYLYAAGVSGSDPILYDTRLDPFQTVNLAHDAAYAGVREALESRRRALLDCEGWSCNRAFGPLPEPRPSR